MNNSVALSQEDITQPGAFINSERFIASALLDQSARTQGVLPPQSSIMPSSSTVVENNVFTFMAASPFPSATAIISVYSSPADSGKIRASYYDLPLPCVLIDPSLDLIACRNQAVQNAAAVALIDSWLNENEGNIDESEANDLDAIRTALDARRSSSRKLFP